MIRNSPGNRKRKNNKPYQRVNVPSEILEQLDALVGESSSPRASGSSGAANEPQQQGGRARKKEREQRIMSPPVVKAARHTHAMSNRRISNPTAMNSSSSRALGGATAIAGDFEDEEMIMEAAYRIAIKPDISIHDGNKSNSPPDPVSNLAPVKLKPRVEATVHRVQPPSSLENGFVPSLGQSPSSHLHGRDAFIPRQSTVMDVEQLRFDLQEVFDDFLARATAVMDRYLEKLQ